MSISLKIVKEAKRKSLINGYHMSHEFHSCKYFFFNLKMKFFYDVLSVTSININFISENGEKMAIYGNDLENGTRIMKIIMASSLVDFIYAQEYFQLRNILKFIFEETLIVICTEKKNVGFTV